MKIALIGTAAGEMEAPFEDESYEIWCMNWNTPRYSRATVDFEVHETRAGKKVKPHVHGIPTITQKNFPHEYIHENFPRYFRENMYKSTLDYMMAYAIYLHKTKEPVEVVEIYGVFMAINDDEYFHQQPSFQAWIGYALSMFDVVIQDKSPLMKSSYIYGQTEAGRDRLFNESQFVMLRAEHEAAIVALRKQIRDAENMIHTHSGCMQAYDRLAATDRARAGGQVITNLNETAQIK